MLADVVRRNAELEEELRTLRAAFVSEKAELEKKLTLSERHCNYLEYQLEKFKHLLFGKRSEKMEAVRADGLLQADLFQEAAREIEEEKEEETEVTYRRKKRRGNRKPLPENLARERVEIDVPTELRTCPDCHGEMSSIGEHVVEELEYIPALLYVIEYAFKKYACKKCKSGVVMEPVPERPIKKGRPGPGLLAWILVSKYQDHLPLHRLERIFERHGLSISRSTLCDWVSAMATLLEPIVQAMKRKLFRARALQADETPIQVRVPELKKETRRSYLWSYGIPGGEVVYDFTVGRGSEGPRAFLEGYEGYLRRREALPIEQPILTAGRGMVSANRRYEGLELPGLVTGLSAEAYYRRPNGAPSDELHNFRPILALLRDLYEARGPYQLVRSPNP